MRRSPRSKRSRRRRRNESGVYNFCLSFQMISSAVDDAHGERVIQRIKDTSWSAAFVNAVMCAIFLRHVAVVARLCELPSVECLDARLEQRSRHRGERFGLAYVVARRLAVPM